MTGMELYAYQRRVLDSVLSGRPVILQAPTGAGKTRAALEPFFLALAQGLPFPRQAIYSVPMRTLANQFLAEHQRALRERPELAHIRATIQTGEHPQDPELWGDLVFTTIDQTLSNWLCLPYSLGSGRANLNPGAIVSAYLVFDEFHLFPLDDAAKGNGARVTTLALLKALDGMVPWVLMTATFSRRLLDRLCEMLRAERVLTDAQDLAEIPSQREKQRRFEVKEKPLEARDVLEAHEERSVAVCNTVERAINLYLELCKQGCHPVPFSSATNVEELGERIASGHDADRPHVMLLHSRFEKRHRALKEELILREFGEARAARRVPSLILVATQVVEVGLNITCERLHTEIAPASSVLQRAGRCARFPGERGEVRIYDVPDDGKDRYAPYSGTDEDTCRKAWEAFRTRSGALLDFEAEQEVIDEVHTSADEQLLEAMQRGDRQLWKGIADAICDQEIALRPCLIRRMDHRTLLVHDNPEALGDPFRCEGFSIRLGTLKGWWQKAKHDPARLDLPWLLQYPLAEEQKGEMGQQLGYTWQPVREENELDATAVLALHPRLVSYDAETGFRFLPSAGDYRSLPAPGTPAGPGWFQYQQETYVSHIRRVIAIYEKRIAPKLHYSLEQLEKRLEVAPGTLANTLRVVLAVHDAGKLSKSWQQWAHAYQNSIGRAVPRDTALAHTDRFTEDHRQAERQIRPRRPNHAAEGAVCCARLLTEAARGNREIVAAALMAVARHHSPRAEEFNQTELIASARQVLEEALRVAVGPASDLPGLAASLCSQTRTAGNLRNYFLKPPPAESWYGWFAYFLLVRALRLADGASLEGSTETSYA